jgi:hypothetical protein
MHNGTWAVDHKVAGPGSFPIRWGEHEAFPIGWCGKRIVNGEEDNVWFKFQLLLLGEGKDAMTSTPDGSDGGVAAAVTSTYDGPIEQYKGGKTLLVAVHARWASVWPMTADALSKVDRGRYDVKLIDADRNKRLVQDLGVKIIPTVIVYRDGREVARLPNMMSLDQLP